MYSFETIRRAAAQLHYEIASQLSDPLDPFAFVKAATDHLGLELYSLPSGDLSLKNAHALFDEQSGAILYENRGSTKQQALLIAHEIGHAQLHAVSSSCTDTDIEPSHPPEVPLIGLGGIEDYGARERRELQANVFAREFLLPRDSIRDLYLERKSTSVQITNWTGLPIALVRQQIFDALLLPRPPRVAAAPPSSNTFRPDRSQRRALNHRELPFQLQAGPGTGKTRTLVGRVESLLADAVAPDSILVVTYSNRAAGELAERLDHIESNISSRIWIGTLHSFGLDLIRRYYDRLGLSSSPKLLDRSDLVEMIEEILPTLPIEHYKNLWDPARILKDVLDAISRAKDELIDPRHYHQLATTMSSNARDDATQRNAEKCLEIAKIYEIYEDTLRNHDAVDFGDLIMRPAMLLETDESVRTEVRLRHRHVLVDEYQDINRASARLLKAVVGDGKRFWTVGDARQSIYRFRGASPSNVTKFTEDFPNAVVDQLTVNYRSTKQLVNSFMEVSNQLRASSNMLQLELDAFRGSGPSSPEVRRFETSDDELAGVAEEIKELQANGIAFRDQALLCRSNRRLNEFAIALQTNGIPVLHLGSLFEREEIRDLIALLSLAVDKFGGGLVRIAAMPRYGLSLQDTHTALQLFAMHHHPALLSLESVSKSSALSQRGQHVMRLLASDLANFKSSEFAWDFLSNYLLDRTSEIRKLAGLSSVSGHMQSIAVWQFLNYLRGQDTRQGGRPIQRTLDRIRNLVWYAEDRELRQIPVAARHLDGVWLMTVHASKGLEFDVVHVPSLTVSSFPLPSRNRSSRPIDILGESDSSPYGNSTKLAKELQIQEEECLFFVAVSRARTHLRLYFSDKASITHRTRKPSPFLDFILHRPAAAIPTLQVSKSMYTSPGDKLLEVIHSTDLNITDSMLMTYEKCPRRFFYTHLLAIGRARKMTAFTKTYDCLHAALDWLTETRHSQVITAKILETRFNEIWQKDGPIDHAFAADYHHLALTLVRLAGKADPDREFINCKVMTLTLPQGTITVEPSDVSRLPNGVIIVRRIRSGKRRSKEYDDDLTYTIYQLAAKETFGSQVRVQALHLSDGNADDVAISDEKIRNRRRRIEGLMAELSSGKFPPKPDEMRCPRCPHFFYCPATPSGTLRLR